MPKTTYTSINDHNFEEIYLKYFSRMVRFAQAYVLEMEEAENIIQDVFITLWERRDDLKIHVSLASYLFILIKNRCIDYLRRKKHAELGKRQMQEDFTHELQMKLYSLEALDTAFVSNSDIERIIAVAVESLPPKCREIFILSKIEGKKNREIAAQLHISESTVENQMGIALRKLRNELKDYMPIFLFLCM